MATNKEIPILYEKKEDCCACGACYNICPKSSISMVEDGAGFFYPQIYPDKCINCMMCVNVCGFQNKKVDNKPLKTFVAVSKSKDLLKKSSSGGVFSAIAKKVLDNGGLVAGAAFDKDWNLSHIIIDDLKDLHKIQGSKYLQSDTKKVFYDIKNFLDSDRKVLFSGTACQVHGLLSFLGRDYDNLFTIDIVCHGVPSNKIFKDYLNSIENKENQKIEDFTFRDKNLGWGLNGSVKFFNGKKKNIWNSNSPYMYFFSKSKIYRDSCFICKYASKNRPADITVGDYWGIEKYHYNLLKNELKEKEGISLILFNTKKSLKYIENIKENINLYPSKFEYVSDKNIQLREPSKKTNSYYFLNGYQEEGWLFLEDYFNKNIGIKKYKSQITALIPKRLLILLKRFK